jgi:hypothetical protein
VSESAPQASFSFDFDVANTNVTVTHEGGETLEPGNIQVQGDGGALSAASGETAFRDASNPISAGNSTTYTGISGGETIRVIWTNPAGGSTNTIARATAPQN